MTTLDEILSFFSQNQIPILPCFGILNGICTCKRGAQCPSPGKHPLMFRWQMLASCDKDVIKGWLSGNGKPVNLAIRTGTRNSLNGKYLVGTDLDLVDHPMKEKLSQYSTTVTQQSGSGGAHAFYWSDLPIRNSVQLVDEKMDIRGSGGIIVIAPSIHKSGNQYRFTCDLKTTQIQDLPDFIVKKLRISSAKTKKTEREAEKPTELSTPKNSELFNQWSQLSIPTIRNALLNGKKVPNGVRNATMHRLLSSDRARGIPTSARLMIKAIEYLPGFENPETLAEELDVIVKSVMRYPAYNNSYEKVNELYVGWLGKNGYKPEYSVEFLEELDRKFFNTLEPASSIDNGFPLAEIAERRAAFMKAAGVTKFATYKPQLLAKKLLSLGIQRRRTSKSNNWQVRFKEVMELNPTTATCETESMNMLEMTTSRQDQEKTTSKNLKDGDIIEVNGKKVRVELLHTQVPVKTHPREFLYQGRKGYEYNKALLQLLSRMTEEQKDELADEEEGTLLMDKEKTVEWMMSTKPGDVIGVVENLYIVLPPPHPEYADADLDLFVVKAKVIPGKPGFYQSVDGMEPKLLTVWQLDHARELGMLDILWRDGKPYNCPEFEDMTVVITHPLDEQRTQNK